MPRVWAFLKTIDAAEAERCRSAGCPHCGGELHSASYPRKPQDMALDALTLEQAVDLLDR